MRRIVLIYALLSVPVLASAEPAERVVLVSVDGLHPALLKRMPVLQSIRVRGSSTLRAETPLPSITVVSHAAMLTGAGPEKNGVSGFEPADEEDQVRWRPLKAASVLQALQSAGRLTAAHIEKKKLYGLLPAEAANWMGFVPSMWKNVEAACVELERVPARGLPQDALFFIHLKRLDDVGHAKGWLSPEQFAAAAEVDKALSSIAACAFQPESPAAAVPTVLIVTADHGGHGRTHGTARASDRLVPWVAFGHGIIPGRRIKARVRLVDTAPTVLRILGLDPKALLPQADGKAVTEILTTQ